MVKQVLKDKEATLDALAREELGIDHDCEMWFERMGINDGGNRVCRVVETVDELEAQSDE